MCQKISKHFSYFTSFCKDLKTSKWRNKLFFWKISILELWRNIDERETFVAFCKFIQQSILTQTKGERGERLSEEEHQELIFDFPLLYRTLESCKFQDKEITNLTWNFFSCTYRNSHCCWMNVRLWWGGGKRPLDSLSEH